MFGPLDKYAAPANYYAIARKLSPWFAATCLLFFITGLYSGLVYAPADYQQGDSFRIIYVHVPAAWMSLFVYVVMALSGAMGLIWRVKVSDVIARSCAPIGAGFTFITLVTGSLWGKPMWGTWWVWDARLTSELILLFLYFGYMALQGAISDRRMAARAGAILALVGLVNIPIIHYSVEWWSTLHQGPTISKFDTPSIHISMLIPLILMLAAFKFYFLYSLMLRSRAEILIQEKNTRWARELAKEKAELS